MSCRLEPAQHRAATGAVTATTGGRFVVKLQGFGAPPDARQLGTVSHPTAVAWYTVPAANAVAWLAVTIVFVGEFQLYVNVTAGFVVIETVSGSIVLLNVTTTTAVRDTPVAPSGGVVTVTCGLGQFVLNVHGFGTDPVTSGKSSFWSCPPIRIVYWVHCVNGVPWVRVRVLNAGFHTGVNEIPGGVSDHVTVVGFIVSLKTTTMFAGPSTFTSPSTGLVDTIVGAVPSVTHWASEVPVVVYSPPVASRR